jgi:hypothetical protein
MDNSFGKLARKTGASTSKSQQIKARTMSEESRTTAPTRRWHTFSIRSFMIVIAVAGLLLAPVVWSVRQVSMERLRAMQAAELARAVAEEQLAVANAIRLRDVAQQSARSAQKLISTSSAQAADGLWVGITANRAVIRPDEASDTRVELTLVNDRDEALDLDQEAPTLEIGERSVSLLKIVTDRNSQGMIAPGERFRCEYNAGESLTTPGTYRVRWFGKSFRSSEITIRVLPSAASAPARDRRSR